MSTYCVEWRGPVRRTSGLGIASREYVQALRRQGVSVQVGTGKRTTVNEAKQRKVLIYHYLPHTLNVGLEKKRYSRVILNAVWETSRIPVHWVAPINRFDAVFVPSRQNRQAMRDSGVKVPIYIVPHGVNAAVYHPRNRKMKVPHAQGKFTFVSVFGFQHRKNPEALLKAYWEAFSASDSVHMVIKTNGYAPHENERWIKARIAGYKQRLSVRNKRTAPVTILAKRLSQSELKGIYTLGDVFVLPTRGEGVGMPFLESLASGTPVIATGWGGHKDFLTTGNTFFINYRLRHPTYGMNSSSAISRPFRSLFSGRGQRWAEVDLGSLKLQMRKAYQNRALCRTKGRQGRQDALRHSWTRAGGIMKHAVEQVIRSSK